MPSIQNVALYKTSGLLYKSLFVLPLKFKTVKYVEMFLNIIIKLLNMEYERLCRSKRFCEYIAELKTITVKINEDKLSTEQYRDLNTKFQVGFSGSCSV